MSDITFRYITPIFNFEVVEFSHSGTCNDATYTIELKKVKQGAEGFAELAKYAKDDTPLQQIHLSETMQQPTDIYLIIDVIHPFDEDLLVAGNTNEILEIHQSILSALQLHSTNGLYYEKTYQFTPDHRLLSGSIGYSSPLTRQRRWSHLGGHRSELPGDQFQPCRDTFEVLLSGLDDSITKDKVLLLAIAYFQASFTFSDVGHSFLILMVAFEAMFKLEKENIGKGASRISKLLSDRKGDRSGIHTQFDSGSADTFGKIRNSISHGSPDSDQAIIKTKFVSLFQFIRRAIIELLMIPGGSIDDSQDYYNEINAYVDNRFNGLPV